MVHKQKEIIKDIDELNEAIESLHHTARIIENFKQLAIKQRAEKQIELNKVENLQKKVTAEVDRVYKNPPPKKLTLDMQTKNLKSRRLVVYGAVLPVT